MPSECPPSCPYHGRTPGGVHIRMTPNLALHWDKTSSLMVGSIFTNVVFMMMLIRLWVVIAYAFLVYFYVASSFTCNSFWNTQSKIASSRPQHPTSLTWRQRTTGTINGGTKTWSMRNASRSSLRGICYSSSLRAVHCSSRWRKFGIPSRAISTGTTSAYLHLLRFWSGISSSSFSGIRLVSG